MVRTRFDGLTCCLHCGASNAKVTDSRYEDDTGWKRRRRACVACGYRWTTIELPELALSSLRESHIAAEEIERLATEMKLRLQGAVGLLGRTSSG